MRLFTASLAGRIALILTIGIVLAAFGAILVTEAGRRGYVRSVRAERIVASAIDVAYRLKRDRAATIARLSGGGLTGAHMLETGRGRGYPPDADRTAMLVARLGPSDRPTLAPAPANVCMADDAFWRRPRTAGFAIPAPPECWLLTIGRGRERLTVTIDLPRLPVPPSSIADPLFVILVILASAVLSILVARFATAPLRRLSAASEAFSCSIDAEPVAETGPSDVRRALATFNIMQARVREGLRDRTRILAAISHDLQTPLTRLRLRLEQVEDEGLRTRLITDLSATLTMVRRGLDLARSGESAEEWSTVNLDSLLSSIAEDAADMGHAVNFVRGCGAKVRVKPDALARCLGNLVDNAIKHAGDADIRCDRRGQSAVVVTIRDHGPGIPAHLVDRAFDPFVGNLSGAAKVDGGSGIGLAIAKAQAAAIGGELSLANHPTGGLSATLLLNEA